MDESSSLLEEALPEGKGAGDAVASDRRRVWLRRVGGLSLLALAAAGAAAVASTTHNMQTTAATANLASFTSSSLSWTARNKVKCKCK